MVTKEYNANQKCKEYIPLKIFLSTDKYTNQAKTQLSKTRMFRSLCSHNYPRQTNKRMWTVKQSVFNSASGHTSMAM